MYNFVENNGEDLLPSFQPHPKKPKLSAEANVQRDPRLRGKVSAQAAAAIPVRFLQEEICEMVL